MLLSSLRAPRWLSTELHYSLILGSSLLVACAESSSEPGGGSGGEDVDKIQPGIGSVACEAAPEGTSWFVDDVEANGDGTAGNPFNTIQAAADVAQPGDTILIRGGTYRETVTPPISGEPERPITFRGCDGPAIVSGADVVNGAWSPVAEQPGAFRIDSPDDAWLRQNQAEQFFFGGRMMIEARHPNTPFGSLDPLRTPSLSIDAVRDEGLAPGDQSPIEIRRIVIQDGEMTDPPGTWNGATVWVTPRNGRGPDGGGWGFRASGTVVDQQHQQLTVDVAIGGAIEHLESPYGEPYHMGQVRAALDAPGEWLRDGDSILFIPPEGADPQQHVAEVKRRTYAFDLSERSHITIEGLTVFGATITTDRDSGNDGRPGTTERGRKDVASSQSVVLERIHAQYINHFTDQAGWSLGQWIQTSGIVLSGSDHVLRDSLIEYAAGNGVLAIGERHRITNNVIHDVNYTGSFAAGISLGMEVENRDFEISRNTVWATGFDGIMARGLWSTDAANPARVHHNRVSGYGLLNRDVGGIKDVGHYEPNGTRWDHNIVSGGDAWAQGLYLDFCTGHVVDHNVVYDADLAMNVNDAIGHKIYHNTLIGRTNSLEGDQQQKDMDLRNNLLSHSLDSLELVSDTSQQNVGNAMLSWFEEPIYGNYQLSTQAEPAINQAVPIVGFNDEAVDPPDVGAYERGMDPWQAGSTVAHPTAAPTRLSASIDGNVQASLSWEDNADNEEHYYVERAIELRNSDWLVFAVIAELPPDATSFVDPEPLPAGLTVYYRVRADRSMHSNLASVRHE